MRKYIILSVNDNQDYLYYTPLTCYLWRKFGWEPVVFFHRQDPNMREQMNLSLWNNKHVGDLVFELNSIPGYRPDTITQTSRLYGSCVIKDSYLMTGDIDMIPLSDFWQPNENEVTVWGHDLTGYGQVPICYVGMSSHKWDEIMEICSDDYNSYLELDLKSLPNASEDIPWEKRWGVDQDLITTNLRSYGFSFIKFIDRGKDIINTDYALGRVDRGKWSLQHNQFIDCHMHRDLFKAWYPDATDTNLNKWSQTMRMLETCFPGENFDWFTEYSKAYAKLAYGK